MQIITLEDDLTAGAAGKLLVLTANRLRGSTLDILLGFKSTTVFEYGSKESVV